MSTYEISKSSLLSLKAEILRKQEDLAKAKADNAEKIKVIKKKSPLELKNKGVNERARRDFGDEEQDLLKLSRSKLETKAKLYDKLSNRILTEDLKRKYLVRFDDKDVDNKCPIDNEEDLDLPPDDDADDQFSDYNDHVDSSDEWVEYIDCLGRSRKCLRKDLEYFKSKDAELKLVADKRHEVESKNTESNKEIGEENIETTNKPEDIQTELDLVSADMRKDMLRRQWEKEEEELRDRSDIHYQNVLFNEARQHGVGYYAFSKDEEERLVQQQALKNLRQETELEQNKAKNIRLLREKQMAARIKAARNRTRARLGLPPEEDTSSDVPSNNKPDENKEVSEEKEKDTDSETQKIAEEKRKRHVRPWDIGKEGLKEHYVMSQNEWNEKQRQERNTEFAPPKSYHGRHFKYVRNIEENLEENKSLKFSTKKSSKKRTKPKYNDYKSNPTKSDSDDELLKDFKESKSFSTSSSESRLYASINPYKRSYESESDCQKTDRECEGQSGYKKVNTSTEQPNLSNTVEAGLRFLRSQIENSSSNGG
ncbi:coiled-coil domain-containing protein 174 [Sitophilus oryzae]|uniref:Coiled-coil domain-containing protein 174 n=1 Tax=Sitophilus oryzae TaxID=7048 RepID=A0A6J2XSR8_SITOR|nr:coiled-coil domain-containing protein 174 [Sitophilus oryzae]